MQRTFHTHHRKNASRILNHEHLCSKQKCTHLCKRSISKALIVHQTPHTNISRLQHPTLINGQVSQTEPTREIKELTDVMTQMDVTDIYRTFQRNTKEQYLMEPSLYLATYSVTKQTSTDTKNQNNALYPIRSPWLKFRIQQQH